MPTALARAGIAVAASMSLWGSVEYLRSESAFHKQGSDPYHVATQGERLGGVRASVPENTVLGYLTDDVPLDGSFPSAQFYLAPRLLQEGAAHDRVLGNFAKPADYAALGRRLGLRVERDFNNGVLLFRRSPSP